VREQDILISGVKTLQGEGIASSKAMVDIYKDYQRMQYP
jgi:hypothetical protein